MRIAFAIVCMTLIGLAVVISRHREVQTQQEIHRLQGQLVSQRRQLWDLDARLGELTSMQALEVRAGDMQAHLLRPGEQFPAQWDQTLAGTTPADLIGR